METTYCAILEHNGNEGETFGYYFPETESTVQLMQEIEAKYSRDELEGYDSEYDFEYGFSPEMLKGISKADNNSYSSAVNVCRTPESLRALQLLKTHARTMPDKACFATHYYGEDEDSDMLYVDIRGKPCDNTHYGFEVMHNDFEAPFMAVKYSKKDFTEIKSPEFDNILDLHNWCEEQFKIAHP